MGLRLVQAAYDEALERVLHDLGTANMPLVFTVTVDFTASFDAAGRLEVEVNDGTDLPYFFEVQGRFGWHRSTLVATEEAEEATVHLADRFQDDVLDALWGPAWPECEGHAHPAVPRLEDEVASWCCPASGLVLCRIGEFGS